MEEKLVLQMDSIVKTFPGVKALDGVHLDVRRGEVHALCGENGAGKSTLMKIIAGAQGYTSGHMYVNGEEVVFHSTKDAERKGIAMIYQEFNMVRDLSVAENMYLGRLPKTPYGAVDWKKLYTCPIARDNTAESKNPIRVMLVSFLLNITAPFEAGKSFIRHRERAAYLHCSRICHIW